MLKQRYWNSIGQRRFRKEHLLVYGATAFVLAYTLVIGASRIQTTMHGEGHRGGSDLILYCINRTDYVRGHDDDIQY